MSTWKGQEGANRHVLCLTAALIISVAVLLVYAQYTTIDKFRVLQPAVGYDTLRDFILTVNDRVPLDRGDAIVVCAIGAMCVFIAVLELWKGSFSLLFGWVCQHERRVQFIFGGMYILCAY